mmetsp:Transcript_17445/g.32491  ORF Transcript_17445/g.32491 Transcript_17445/m.32491 type:complete len:229 (-) Transcript_17445:18-704(-)
MMETNKFATYHYVEVPEGNKQETTSNHNPYWRIIKFSVSGNVVLLLFLTASVFSGHRLKLPLPVPMRHIGMLRFNGAVEEGKNGTFLDRNGGFLRHVNNDGAIFDTTTGEVGRIDEKGFVSDSNGIVVNQVDILGLNGCAIFVDGIGFVGIVEESSEYGAVLDRDGVFLGNANKDGAIIDTTSREVGSVDENGFVSDSNDIIIGRIDSRLCGNSTICKGGSALLMYFK